MAEDRFFQNPDLNGQARFLEGQKKTGFLLIHGFTATCIEVSWLAEFFNKQGYPVMLPLLPGHGTTPEDLNQKKYQDWIDCVELAYQQLSSHVNNIVVGGESMGAVLALHLAAAHSEIRALLLYSPALEAPNLKFSRWMKIFRRVIPKNNDHDDEIPWQGYTVWPLKAAYEFYKMQHIVKNELSGINVPTAIFHGRFDQTIDPGVSDFIFHKINSLEKNIFHMENSGHVMLLDREFNQIAEKSKAFLLSNKIL